jgi:hypothetical protein
MNEGQHRKRGLSRAFADCPPANKYARFELDLTSSWTCSLVLVSHGPHAFVIHALHFPCTSLSSANLQLLLDV